MRGSGKRNSLLEDAEPTSNPFAMFQTIPVSNDEPDREEPASIVPPRQAKRQSLKTNKKRHSQKRMSAPAVHQQADLLPADLFTASPFDPFAPPGTASQSGSATSSARSSGVFDPLNMPRASSQPRDSVNSVTSGELFDPNMWGFGQSSASASDPFAVPIGGPAPLQHTSSNPAPATRPKTRSTILPSLPESVGRKDAGAGGGDDDEDETESDEEKDTVGDLDTAEVSRRRDAAAAASRRASEPAHGVAETSNCLPELHRGTALLKYPRRHGFPHFKHVQLSRDNNRIQWFSKRKTLDDTCIYVSDVREVVEGQKTEVFKKYRQQVLDKASFSIVYGHDYKTFDVVAKSTDECHMWVLGIRKLMDLHREHLHREGKPLAELTTLDVGIKFRDRNRPQSRRGSGRFLRANNSKALNVDPSTLKEVEKDLDNLQRAYHRVSQLAQRPNITRSPEFHNIQQVLSELEERLEELTHEVANTRDTDMSQRDVWRANVDLTAIQEKIEVLLKYFDANGRPKG